MSEVAEVEVAENKVVVAPRLCKGAMPMALVHYIKFKEPKDCVSDIAKKYFTTPGKISDIQKNANQKYIVENMTFTSEELDAAAAKVAENFVRGQNEDGTPLDAANKRGTATTTAEDAAYSLEVIEIIRGLDADEDAVSLEAARATYNEANPRARKAKVETTEADTETEAVLDEELDDDMDDLLDEE